MNVDEREWDPEGSTREVGVAPNWRWREEFVSARRMEEPIEVPLAAIGKMVSLVRAKRFRIVRE